MSDSSAFLGSGPLSSNGSHTQPARNPASSNCPPDDALSSFLEDNLPDESREMLSHHIDGCPLCQDRLDRLTSATEGAVARIRAHSQLISREPDSSRESTLFDGTSSAPSARIPRVPGFDVQEEIGKGGMGIVYRARHRRLNRPVALKMISAGIHSDPRTVQRFFFEAEVMARVRHPQVVEVFEANVYQGPDGVAVPYLAMELLEGGTLRQVLRRSKLDPREAATLVEGLARAVHAAHLQGIVHRDLKPGNILFPGNSEGPSGIFDGDYGILKWDASLPKVTDFGLAKLVQPLDQEMTATGQVIGTPAYMAPEQANGDAIGPETDVYALGTMLYEMLTGQTPFSGRESMKVLAKVISEAPVPVDRLRPNLPRDLAAVTMKCLEKKPSQRYGSAEALAEDLRRFLDNRPTMARPVRPIERTWRLARRNPAIAGLLATLAVVMLVGVATVFTLWQRAERNAADERQAKEVSLTALRSADAKQARLEFDRGLSLCEEGQVPRGLQYLQQAHALAEASGSISLAQVAHKNLAIWPRVLFQTRQEVRTTSPTMAVCFSKDGSRFATAGAKGSLALWDSGNGEKLREYIADSETASYASVAISPDGTRLVTGGDNGRVRVWDVNQTKPLRSFAASEGKADPVSSLAFAADGTLWVADSSQGVKRWDVETMTVVGEAKGPSLRGQVLIMLLSRDGQRLYLGDRAGVVFEWDLTKQQVMRGWPMYKEITAIALNADETALAITGFSGRGLIIDFATNRIDHDISLQGSVGLAAAFAGDLLLLGDSDGHVRAYHRVTGQLVGTPMGLSAPVSALQMRPGSLEFAVAAEEAVRLARPPAVPFEVLATGVGRVNAAAYSPGGERIAVAAERQVLTFEGTQPMARKTQNVPTEPLALCFDDSHSRVLCGGRESWFALPLDGTPQVAEGSENGAPYHAIALVNQGRTVITGNALGLRMWDAQSLRGLANAPTLPLPEGARSLALLNATELLVVTRRRIEFLNTESLRPTRSPLTFPDVVTCVAANGERLLVGLLNNTAQWIDESASPEGLPALSHGRSVQAVAISPDASCLVSGSRDGTVRVWDSATGLPLGPILRQPGPVAAVAYSPRGSHVVTGTTNGHVLRWIVP